MVFHTPSTNQDFDLTDRQKRAASVAWYNQPMGRYLMNDVLLSGVRDRLDLSQFAQHATCQYTARTSQRLCATPLDVRGLHCSKCCHALTQARHHLLRDWIKAQLNTCGEHAAIEQNVLTRAGPDTAAAGTQSDLWHRADIVSIDAAGCRTIYDVAVVSSPLGGCAQTDCQRVTQAKLAAYGATSTHQVQFARRHGAAFGIPCDSWPGSCNPSILLATGRAASAQADTNAWW